LKAFPCLGALILILSILALPALPEYRQNIFSSTKAFLIDGKRYLLEKAAGGDLSLIRRELKRHGWDVPIPGKPQPANPYFEDALRADNGTASSTPIPLPQGLHLEHVVQLMPDSGPVELVVGSMDTRGPSARNRLPESGWKRIEAAQGQEPIAVAMRKNGKETFLVFLEEKRGKFLLVRKPE
jgi:hypothetical protein